MDKHNTSFTSADVDFPAKIIANKKVLHMLYQGIIQPVHLQLNPTNRCNLDCSFCSCKGVDRQQELEYGRLKNYLDIMNCTLAVTLTGGGEPTMHKRFVDIVQLLYQRNIKIGMATNGLLLHKYDPKLFDNFTWIRISLSSESLRTGIIDISEEYIRKSTKCDWAFSYVCSGNTDEDVEILSAFINKYGTNVTHYRVVNDILNPDDRVMRLKSRLHGYYKNCVIIFQERQRFTRGDPQCRISMLKPVITADGMIQPCCGAQYAIKDARVQRKYINEFNMGSIEDAKDVFSRSFFDGSHCDICYYNNYNKALAMFMNSVSHESFI